MLKYILKRLALLFLTLFIIIAITFFLMKLLPGTPFNNPKMPPEQLAQLRKEYGLDKSVLEQFIQYFLGILRFDFGNSFQNQQPIADLIATRIGPSVQVGSQALILGTFLGILLGAVAAIKKNTWVDATATIFAVIGRSIPSFVLAALLQLWLGLKLGIFPIAFWDQSTSSVLPTLSLAATPLAITARFMRTEMIDILNSDYIELARSKGNSNWQAVAKHALRNSLIPITTILGPMAIGLMTGSLVIENIFSIPGIGQQFVQSITTNDYPTIMGLAILYAVLLMVVNLIVDIVYGLIDPRIQLSEEGR